MWKDLNEVFRSRKKMIIETISRNRSSQNIIYCHNLKTIGLIDNVSNVLY